MEHPSQPSDPSSLPPGLLAALQREVDSGETLVWCAQPRPDLAWRATWRRLLVAYLFLGLFAPMAGFAVFEVLRQALDPAVPWTIGGAIGNIAIAGIVALSVTVVLVWTLTEPGRVRARATRTVYAVTTRRAIVLSSNARGLIEERDFAPDETRRVLRRERPDGAGDVIFETSRRSPGSGSADPTGLTPLGFLHVDRCAEVERILRTTLQPGPIDEP